MELFDAYKNKFLNAFIILTERLLNGEKIKKYNFLNTFYQLANDDTYQGEVLSNKVTNGKNEFFVVDNDGYMTLNENFEASNKNITLRLFTESERLWLKEALNSKISNIFFKYSELNEFGADRNLLWYSFIDDKNIKPNYKQNLKKNMKILLEAINSKSKIKYTYKGSEKREYESLPVKIEYDNRKQRFYAILWNGSRMIKSILSKMIDIEITDKYNDEDYSVSEFMKKRRNKEPVVFYVSDKRNHNAINRAIETFCIYEHTIEEQEDNTIKCTINYYDIDSDLLFDDILSFGADIQVISPQNAIDKIKHRLEGI